MFAIIVVILALFLFNYMDTLVPEGVTEVWSARILDTTLRTNAKAVMPLSPIFRYCINIINLNIFHSQLDMFLNK